MDLSSDNVSALITEALLRTYRDAPVKDPRGHLLEFEHERRRDIYWLVGRYGSDPLVGPLPELAQLAAILERLERDPTGLVTNWPRELPSYWLETLAELWGAPL